MWEGVTTRHGAPYWGEGIVWTCRQLQEAGGNDLPTLKSGVTNRIAMFNPKSDKNVPMVFNSVEDQNGFKGQDHESNSQEVFMYYSDVENMNCPCLAFEDLSRMIEEYFYVDVPIYANEITSSEFYEHDVSIIADDIAKRVNYCPATQ